MNVPDLKTAEYIELSQHYRQAILYRFQLIGFLVAGIAFVVGKDTTKWSSIPIALIILAVWIIELRNRTVLLSIAKRMCDIELEVYGTKAVSFMRFYHGHDFKVSQKTSHEQRTAEDLKSHPTNRNQGFYQIRTWLFFRKWQFRKTQPTHTFGIDILLACLLLFTIAKFFFYDWMSESEKQSPVTISLPLQTSSPGKE